MKQKRILRINIFKKLCVHAKHVCVCVLYLQARVCGKHMPVCVVCIYCVCGRYMLASVYVYKVGVV